MMKLEDQFLKKLYDKTGRNIEKVEDTQPIFKELDVDEREFGDMVEGLRRERLIEIKKRVEGAPEVFLVCITDEGALRAENLQRVPRNVGDHEMDNVPKKTVFISYAKEDIYSAMRLYDHLIAAGVDAWIDKECLLPGQDWKVAIGEAIQNADYFVALLSDNSVSKIGYVQSELADALKILEHHPENDIFIIPARLSDCKPSHSKMQDIHWVDLHTDWENGIRGILQAIEIGEKRTKGVRVPPTEMRDLDNVRDKSAHDLNNISKEDEELINSWVSRKLRNKKVWQMEREINRRGLMDACLRKLAEVMGKR